MSAEPLDPQRIVPADKESSKLKLRLKYMRL